MIKANYAFIALSVNETMRSDSEDLLSFFRIEPAALSGCPLLFELTPMQRNGSSPQLSNEAQILSLVDGSLELRCDSGAKTIGLYDA